MFTELPEEVSWAQPQSRQRAQQERRPRDGNSQKSLREESGVPWGPEWDELAEALGKTELIFRLEPGGEPDESWRDSGQEARPGGGGPPSAHSLPCDSGDI